MLHMLWQHVLGKPFLCSCRVAHACLWDIHAWHEFAWKQSIGYATTWTWLYSKFRLANTSGAVCPQPASLGGTGPLGSLDCMNIFKYRKNSLGFRAGKKRAAFPPVDWTRWGKNIRFIDFVFPQNQLNRFCVSTIWTLEILCFHIVLIL